LLKQTFEQRAEHRWDILLAEPQMQLLVAPLEREVVLEPVGGAPPARGFRGLGQRFEIDLFEQLVDFPGLVWRQLA
jgi:hypothetical protein